MSSLIPFSFETHQVRIVTDENGEPLFVAKDVMLALGYADVSNITKSIAHVPDEWKGREPIPTTEGVREAAVLTEQGFYFFLNRSDKPGAIPLQKLVAGEILPSIRKTGSYHADNASPAQQLDANITALKLSPLAARAARALGFKGNMAALSADHAVRVITGSSPLALLGQTALKAEHQDALLLVTEISERLGIKPREVNPLLTKSGLQTEYRDAHNKLCYELTETGLAFGIYLDTGKKHGDGTPVRQIKWRASVVEFLTGQVRISGEAA